MLKVCVCVCVFAKWGLCVQETRCFRKFPNEAYVVAEVTKPTWSRKYVGSKGGNLVTSLLSNKAIKESDFV